MEKKWYVTIRFGGVVSMLPIAYETKEEALIAINRWKVDNRAMLCGDGIFGVYEK